MKVLLLVGTELENSNTSKVVSRLEKSIEEKFGKDVTIIRHDQNTLNAKHCIGCCNCFKNGVCTLKNKDGIEILKRDMEDSDIVYFVSPVYFHQVSGTMKVFIDRLSYWVHILKLVGRIGASISVSSTNGNEYVDFYLSKFLEYLGIIVVDKVAIKMDVDSEMDVEEKLNKSTEIVYNNYLNRKTLQPSQKQNIYFHQMRSHYESLNGQGFESNYWISNGYLNYLTFEELWKSRVK